MKRTGPTNPELQDVIQLLKKEGSIKQVALWKRIAEDLEKPTRKRIEVNLSRVSRVTQPNETIIVPGKVLGAGGMQHKLVVAAFAFSQGARDSIQAAKGTCMSIPELIKQNPKGTNIKVIA